VPTNETERLPSTSGILQRKRALQKVLFELTYVAYDFGSETVILLHLLARKSSIPIIYQKLKGRLHPRRI
jgi:ribosomal protein L7Ae-like RNA K-turn-binding protein